MSKQQTKQNLKKSKQDRAKPPQSAQPSKTAVSSLTSASPIQQTLATADQLQRTIGNQAVGHLLIQPKLRLGPVGDKYEQEADAVAKQVVGHLATSDQPATQRQEEEELQLKPETAVQRQEDEEMQLKPITAVQRQEDEEMQLKPITAVQRQEDEEMQLKSETAVQRQSNRGGEIPADLEQSIQSARGAGQPLSDTIRTPMENAFGSDFSGVNIHTSSQSNTLNQSLQARAFTTGQDIFFRSGEYNPSSSGGQELIAHELTHVVQQSGQTVQREGDGEEEVSGGGQETGKSITTEFGTFIVYPDNVQMSLAPSAYEGELHVKQAVFNRINSVIASISGGGAGIKIEGTTDFKASVLSDLAWLLTQSVGRQLLDEIVASGKELTIETSSGGNTEIADNFNAGLLKSNGKPGDGTNVTIKFNAGKKSIGTGLEDWMKRPPAIGLVHEMIHAWADMKGVTAAKGTGAVPGYERQAVGLSEYEDAVLSENKFRAAFGLPLRPRY